ncbi:MAG: patatin-like phospholipase family protein, partial [Nanoarchaeota archaeon]|nr:patatin-like phospholipase family protein [Nanoarchaeota archaeon]
MIKKRNLKLGLALGAGGARGLAHIGVLKVLHEAGIRPDFLAGTSMGAVIGALYAAGKSPEWIEELVKTTDWKKMMDVSVPKTGFLQGKIVEENLRKLLWNKPFHRLKIPFQVVAYNLTKKKEIIFSAGDVAQAVRASISIPGVFSPAHIKRDEYIDGAVANPTPFDVVRKMGADIVIAVDLFPKRSSMQGPLLHKSSLVQDIE